MPKKVETVEARAVHIAAVIMQIDGLCRYDRRDKCRRVWPKDQDCVACIERWLLTKARKEMEKNA